jgi:membrane protein implicated in regulation of membrane protease activity
MIIFCLVVVGGALIALILGPEALITALPCLLGAAGLILGLWLLFVIIQWWLDRLDRVGRSEPKILNKSTEQEEDSLP